MKAVFPAMLTLILNLFLLIFVACAMEGVAWFTHKFVMHGFLWVLHEDHHHPKHRGLQRNDLFAVFFALLSMGLIAAGVLAGPRALAFAGAGVALYGVGYFLFHEVMFHRRIPALHLPPRGRYLHRIVRAHSAHHRYSGAHEGVSFSFLYAGKEYDA
jgi:beta-carotene 3-hydroxylase